MKHPDAPLDSPWGAVQTSSKIGDGMYRVQTARHGGIYVVLENCDAIPSRFRGCMVWPYRGKFFEEDEEYAIPFYYLASLLYKPEDDESRASTEATIAEWNRLYPEPMGENK